MSGRNSAVSRWLRDPLAHFLIAGAMLFALFVWRGEEADPASRSIEVGRERQAALALRFERTLGRPPTDAEIDGLIAQWVRDQVLYREALRLGLDRDDPVVRRRLASKMDELASARAETATPDDAVLRQWLADHPGRFASEVELSFDQLYFASEGAARAGLARLTAGADWRALGEPLSVPASVERIDRRALAKEFGAQFAAEIARLEMSKGWQGPVASGFGWHLVRLRRREVGEPPEFAAIRGHVEDDWRNATIAARKQRAYALLRDAYSVEIAE